LVIQLHKEEYIAKGKLRAQQQIKEMVEGFQRENGQVECCYLVQKNTRIV